MKVIRTALPEVLVIEPEVFADDRGFFFEGFNQERYAEAIGGNVSFVQDNQSRSRRGVVRGLHYQLAPKAQGKLVRVVQGEIFDVAVDIRKSSARFGRWIGEILTAENKKQLWIPPGFAHGFQALSETAEVLYKTTDYWSAAHERVLLWNDADIAIEWRSTASPTGDVVLPILAPKDRQGAYLKDSGV
jgi:dTDP-4-dehydrorhamnose 3,5-epimerase